MLDNLRKAGRLISALAAACLLTLQTANPAGAADATYLLQSGCQTGHLASVKAHLEVGGEVILADKGKPVRLPMSVVATLNYDERLLDWSTQPKGTRRSLRHYGDIDATIKIEKGGVQPTLRDSRRLIALSTADGQTTLFSPSGPLTSDEYELLDIPANSLWVELLLPDEEAVPVGHTWKTADETLAALLGLDAISQNEVQSVLSEVKGDVAEVSIAGGVSGAVGGVSSDIDLKGKYHFDLKQHRITWLTIAVKEKRSVGHVGPGLDVVAKLTLDIVPLEKSEHLDDDAIAGLTLKPRPGETDIAYESPQSGIRFTHDRNWHVTGQDGETVVLRRVERGDLLAQCNVTAAAKAEGDKPITLVEFQRQVETALGKNFGQFTRASESKNRGGYRVLRAVVTGTTSEVPVEWIYYLISDGAGRRTALTFTMEGSVAERFHDADRPLIDSFEFIEPVPTVSRK
jgi:hypothetical protein